METTLNPADSDTFGARASEPPTPMERLQTVSANLDQVSKLVEDRDQLLIELAGVLVNHSNAGIVARIFSGPVAQLAESEVCVLASRYKQIPNNLEQWATTIGLKAILGQQLCFDSATTASDQLLHMVAVPIRRSDGTNEALAAMFVNGSPNALAEAVEIQSAIVAVERWDTLRDNALNSQLARDAAALTEFAARIECEESALACCQQIANRMQKYLGAIEQTNFAGTASKAAPEIEVYLALKDAGGQTKLAAVSNADSLPDNLLLVECVESAISECLCRNTETRWPAEAGDRHALNCHQRMAKEFSRTDLISVPLRDASGNPRAVMLVTAGLPLSQRSRRFCATSGNSLGSILALMERAQQNRLQRLLTKARESLKTQKAKRVLQCVGVLLLIGLIPWPYRIAADCEIQPSTRRFICSPFDSQLKECLVEPGDIVNENEIVARLDEREIRMELAEIEADVHRASKKRDGFVAAHESGEARLAELEADKLRARNDLLNHRTGNLELRSPITGIVISGDLKKAEGMPVETGQSLLEIAPLDDLYVEVLVPEDDVRYVQPGMSVRVSLKSFPFASWQGSVERVHPAAEIRNDNNVFVAKVRFAAATNPAAANLRPGMQGSARISSVWRPICWNLLHQPAAKGLRWLGW